MVDAELDSAKLVELYEKMVLLRQFELAVQSIFKRGELPGFIHLYVGQEAVAVGVCAHLGDEDWITSTHRGHGHALAKGTSPRVLMAELFGKATGCCGGRGGSMHLYDPNHGVFGTNGIVAAGIPHAVGAALSARTRKSREVSVAFFGDGATNHGAFHESFNFAATQRAGTLFVCENNLYATATPYSSITLNADIASKAAAYGVPGVAVDGNDVLAVWASARDAVARARAGGGPTLIEAKTYRYVGHHEGEPIVGTYRRRDELDAWRERCPIATFRRRLIEDFGVASVSDLADVDARVQAIVDDAVEFARRSPEPDPTSVLAHCWSEPMSDVTPAAAASKATVTQGWLEAVRDGIAEEMRRDPHILYFGEGTGERGGSFAHTKGLWTEFGGDRMIDTPISELGFTGAAIGASATGCRSIADLLFADFLFETGGQIPLQAAKLRYMSNGAMAAPVVLRAACGAIKSAGPHHSGMYHPMWGHVPGLLVALPSNPADAKGMMKAALRGNDPVVFLEPKALFASKGEVPTGEYIVPLGVARIARSGQDITIATIGRMVPLALQAAQSLEDEGVQCEVIDLRTIAPLDVDTIVNSVRWTRRLLVVDEGYSMFGLGAEIAAAVGELAFDSLDGPVGRLHAEPVAHPFNPTLEQHMLPTMAKIVAAVTSTLVGKVQAPFRPRVFKAADGKTEMANARGQAKPMPRIETQESAAAEHLSPESVGDEVITMPHGDLTVSEGKVVKWLKNSGETFATGEIVAELETDKAILEIEAPAAGRLKSIVAPVGRMVRMGERLATFVKI